MRSLSPSLLAAASLGACLVSASAFADAPPPDETPPEVSIVTPKSGSAVPAGTKGITVEVTAVEEESGVTWVKLEVDGKSVAKLEEEPWVFRSVSLEPGEHTLVATAHNYDGGIGKSAKVKVTWPEAPKAEAPKEVKPEPPADTKLVDAKAPQGEDSAKAAPGSSDTKPTDTKPTDTKPTDTKPADTKPTDTKPADKADKKGCSVSAVGPSWGGAGVAFGLAIVAGFVLRRPRRKA